VVARIWHAAIAITVLAGLVVQVVLVATLSSRPHQLTPGMIAGATAAGRYVRTFSFFTIQSNILAGASSALLALAPHRDGRAVRILRLDALLGITVTGIVYATVLARIHEPKGWEQLATNTIFHYVTPIAMVVGWLLFGPRPRVDARVAITVLAWPIAWFGYTLARGRIDPWYPYPFVDVTSHGYARVVLNAAAVTIVLAITGGLFWAGDRLPLLATRWWREPAPPVWSATAVPQPVPPAREG
jgi:uncharacterized membrane protein